MVLKPPGSGMALEGDYENVLQGCCIFDDAFMQARTLLCYLQFSQYTELMTSDQIYKLNTNIKA